jgi:hypothetical protein|tara:strand:+ start:345 stop:542 length:198 start_codon:yes stop_codon:yes gene_type:complete
MTDQTVTAEYLMGISDARKFMRAYPHINPATEIDTLTSTIKLFGASSPVGQMLRGERDFWRNQIK